jgi:hypothetical protein
MRIHVAVCGIVKGKNKPDPQFLFHQIPQYKNTLVLQSEQPSWFCRETFSVSAAQIPIYALIQLA